MDKSSVCRLINVSHEKNENGVMIPREESREVFCRVESVYSAEWIAAGSRGIRAELKLTVFTYDYEGEETVEFDGVRYGVYRTYFAPNEETELYLERKAGVR